MGGGGFCSNKWLVQTLFTTPPIKVLLRECFFTMRNENDEGKAAGPDGGEETRAEHGRTEGQVVMMIIMHFDDDDGGGGDNDEKKK